jgi:ABC-type bacteriocin/lantibiotic exporter with double-glycine peptidase domain
MNVKTLHLVSLIFLLCGCSGEKFLSGDLGEISEIEAIETKKQTGQFSCGIASLVCVLDYWDFEVEESKILQKFPPGSEELGYSIIELRQIAKDFGVEAFLLEGDIDFLREQILLGRPLIIPIWISDNWEFLIGGLKVFGGAYNHYVVAYGFSEGHVCVMDPDKGKRIISVVRFMKMWEVNGSVSLLIARVES